MSYEDQRELYRRLRADQQIVERAARGLRDRAISGGYLGLEHKHVAFALALLLDEVARHLRGLDNELRSGLVDACQLLATGVTVSSRSTTDSE